VLRCRADDAETTGGQGGSVELSTVLMDVFRTVASAHGLSLSRLVTADGLYRGKNPYQLSWQFINCDVVDPAGR